MTRPRKELVFVQDTPYYHVVSRCARRTLLCGSDQQTSCDYEHCRQWIVNRLRLLSSLFAIEICAYAVLGNHYHVVIKLELQKAESWTSSDVIERWTSLHKGPLLVQRYQSGETLAHAELEAVNNTVAVWRQRLTDLSWFMKCLNEPIARKANKEVQCTGHFWESRYKSQALLTEQAILSSMVYVDLNPIRAGIADTPETSDYTSIQARIGPQFDLVDAIREQNEQGALHRFDLPLKPLMPFSDDITTEPNHGIAFHFIDYLTLVDWTGRTIRNDKYDFIPNHLPPMLKRLSTSTKDWLLSASMLETIYLQKNTTGYTTSSRQT